MEDRIMRKYCGKVVATILSLALVFSVPIVGRAVRNNVKADDYKLVWSDEFNGTSLNRNNWNVEVNGNGGGNNEHQYYCDRTQNIEVSNGTLKIHALHENYSVGANTWYYTSGRMTTQRKRAFKYGKIEARLKLPRFMGAWPAFWMLGENISSVSWPKCGEMDIMEAINNDNKIYSNLHWSYRNGTRSTSGRAYDIGDRTQWHVYTMEWDADQAKFYADGELYQSFNIKTEDEMEAFRQKQFIILNLAIGGSWPGHNIDNTAFPSRSTMEVDYVRVYQKGPDVTTIYDGPTKLISEDAVQQYTGTWNSFFGGNWLDAHGELFPTGKPSEGYKLEVTSVGIIADDSMWCVQGNLERLSYRAGRTYIYKCTLMSNKDKKVYVKVADGSESEMAGAIIQLTANVKKQVELTVEIPEDFESTISLKFGWGKMSGDTIEDYGSLTAHVSDVSFVTTTSVPDPTKATKKTVTTKVKAANKVTVKKAKIKKVVRKKKSLKVKIKKIKSVTRYHVKYSDSKKFDGYWEKYIKKTSVKLKNLDRKTKYYIKARAYKQVGNRFYYGKFSKTKKAKTK